MEIFRNPNFDFLKFRRWAFGVSAALVVLAVVSFAVKGITYGIDFKGGAMMVVKWDGQPPIDQIRAAMSRAVPGEISVYEVGDFTDRDEVVIGTELQEERQLNVNRQLMQEALESSFGQPDSGKLEFNNAGQQQVADRLREPLQRAGIPKSEQELQALAAALVEFRNTPPRSGLLSSFNQLAAVPGATPEIVRVIEAESYLAPFAVRQVEMVGPKVGAELRHRAILATLYALAGMLVYIAFRFEWIYGVGAVFATFHDTLITIGLFSLLGKEISLTVIAALLTLVGYSMNDKIVIFDRIRENLRISRREPLGALINRSINQTLSRTVLTSGLTFLAVMSLYLFGGPVLNAFSFALVVGIIIGTYSSVFIASPVVVWWNERSGAKKAAKKTAPAPPAVSNPTVTHGKKGQTKALKS
jgi:preprotein translocase subunit SecF